MSLIDVGVIVVISKLRGLTPLAMFDKAVPFELFPGFVYMFAKRPYKLKYLHAI